MKRLFLVGLLALLIMPIFAQELPPTPGTPWEALGSFSYLIGSFGGVVALMFFAVPFILGALNVTGKFLKYLVTVIVIAALTVAAYFLGFGYLNGAEWWAIPVNVGLLALIQVGGFAFPFVKSLQDKIYEKWNPWKPTEEDT
jgi:hypothetical protein